MYNRKRPHYLVVLLLSAPYSNIMTSYWSWGSAVYPNLEAQMFLSMVNAALALPILAWCHGLGHFACQPYFPGRWRVQLWWAHQHLRLVFGKWWWSSIFCCLLWSWFPLLLMLFLSFICLWWCERRAKSSTKSR